MPYSPLKIKLKIKKLKKIKNLKKKKTGSSSLPHGRFGPWGGSATCTRPKRIKKIGHKIWPLGVVTTTPVLLFGGGSATPLFFFLSKHIYSSGRH